MEDHIHILSDIHSSYALSDFVKAIKVATSLWVKQSSDFPAFRGWEEGYAAFTYSYKDKEMLINYIKNQMNENSRRVHSCRKYKSRYFVVVANYKGTPVKLFYIKYILMIRFYRSLCDYP